MLRRTKFSVHTSKRAKLLDVQYFTRSKNFQLIENVGFYSYKNVLRSFLTSGFCSALFLFLDIEGVSVRKLCAA